MERRKRKLEIISIMCDCGGVMDDLRSNDSDGETSSVEPASGTEGRSVGNLIALTVAAKALPGIAGAVTKGSVDVASAARCTIAGEDSDSDHGTTAENVEDQAEESEEGLAAKAAGEDDCGNGVKNGRTRQTLYGLLPARNGDITVSLNCEEVGVDSENDCSTAELQGV